MVNSDVEKAIARFGGTAVYDYKGSWLRHSRQMPEQLNDSWLTLQLRSIGGDRAFGNIRRVEFFAPPTPTPEVISTLGNLSSLHAVSFSNATVDKIFLENLAGRTDLMALEFRECRFAEDSLDALKHFENLESLIFWGAGFEQVPADTLKSLPSLREIGIIGADVDHQQLEKIASLDNLELLSLNFSTIVDHWPPGLKFANVQRFSTSGPSFTDADLKLVVDQMPELQYVVLRHTSVTDNGVPHLAKLEQLNSLRILVDSDTVSVEAIDELKSHLPYGSKTQPTV